MSFFRRKDLSVIDRAVMGLTAIAGSGIYGTIVDIASSYNVSRPFVYELKSKIINSFNTINNKGAEEKEMMINMANQMILTMRLCCKSSIGGISEALKLLKLPNSSIGYVSQFLNNKASYLIDDLPVLVKPITVLADEVFICGMPVLVIIDAVSHLILSIELTGDRTGDTWNNSFQSLSSKGYTIQKVTKDLGSGLLKGANLSGLISQADLFHLQKPFDVLLGTLTSQAERAIESEEKALKVLNNRKSDSAILKSVEQCMNIMDETASKIDAYDNYDFLHYELHLAFDTFNIDGTFRKRDEIYGDAMAAIDLMEEFFGNYTVMKKSIAFLRNNIEGYFPFIYEVENILQFYSTRLPDFIIKHVTLAYQWNLKSIAVKNYQTGKKSANIAEEHITIALTATRNENEKNDVEKLATALSECSRSSSALEAKNSVIRKYANASTNQITQEHLNLIAFYMNRKVAIRGKYKGWSPLERFSGIKEQSSFLELLLSQK